MFVDAKLSFSQAEHLTVIVNAKPKGLLTSASLGEVSPNMNPQLRQRKQE